jgi:hypothetical protein
MGAEWFAQSGIPALSTMANSIAFLMSYSNEDPAILTGSLATDEDPCEPCRVASSTSYKNYAVGLTASTRHPVGFEMGARNNLRGPGFVDLDLGLGKTFPLYPKEGVNLKFRVDAFNADEPSELCDAGFYGRYATDQCAEPVRRHYEHGDSHRQRSLRSCIAGLAAGGVLTRLRRDPGGSSGRNRGGRRGRGRGGRSPQGEC